MAAQNGATTRDLMARAGHRTARASLIYQHTAEERNTAIAAGLDVLGQPHSLALNPLETAAEPILPLTKAGGTS